MTIELQSALIGGATAALISGLISLVATLVTVRLNNRSEERKLKMQLAVTASISEYTERVKFIAETKSKAVKTNTIPHLIHIAYYALTGISDSCKSEKALRDHLKKVYDFQELLHQDLANRLKNANAERTTNEKEKS